VLSLGTPGCEEEKPKKPVADAGPDDKQPLVDGKLAEAMKSAQLQSSAEAPPSVDGPPPNGVFAPGQADKAHAPGAPLKLEILSSGTEPRVNLRPPLDLGKTKSFTLQVGKRLEQRVRPPLDYELAVSLQEPEKPEGGEAPTATARTIRFTIKKVGLSGQEGALPADAAKQLNSLKGSSVSAELAPDGSLSKVQMAMAPEAEKGLDELVADVAETLDLFFSPWPDKPMGVGAYWMATDRVILSTLPVVRYRVTRIESIEGDVISVSLDIRNYALDPQRLPAGVPADQGLLLVGFNAGGKGTFTRGLKELIPSEGQLKLPLQLHLGDDMEKPQRQGQITIESTGAIVKPGTEVPGAASGAPAPGGAPAPAAPAPAAPPDQPANGP
jgi:hypothetical protein